jgi:hypothetical protein
MRSLSSLSVWRRHTMRCVAAGGRQWTRSSGEMVLRRGDSSGASCGPNLGPRGSGLRVLDPGVAC